MLLGDMVQDYRLVDDQCRFRPVNCKRKEAYCVPNGGAIVQGLTLMVRIDSMPEVSLSASDEAYRLVGLELDVAKAATYGSRTRICGRIDTVDGDVMVIHISFIPSNFTGDDVCYYLVYDSAAASLFLLPRRPNSCLCNVTNAPLKIAEEDDKYSLVLMAERHGEPVIGLWSPPDGCRRRDGHGKGAWVVKHCLPPYAAWAVPFEAHVAFSCNGNAVWGDLGQGILYCRCTDLIDCPGPVRFNHIMLPEECRTAYNKCDWDQVPMDVYRNMGRVGDSIWFVIIEPSESCPGDTKVKVWTLDLQTGKEEWNLRTDFRMQSVLGKVFPPQRPWPRLPETVPLYPFFRQQDDRGIYMLLRDPYRGDGEDYAHLVCIDFGGYNVRIRNRSPPFPLPMMELPVVVHRDFFGKAV